MQRTTVVTGGASVNISSTPAARAISGAVLPIDGGWLARVTYTQHPGWPPEGGS